MHSNYEFKSDGSLKKPSNNKDFKPSLSQRIKRYILKHNLDVRITKNSRYIVFNWLGYELVWQRR